MKTPTIILAGPDQQIIWRTLRMLMSRYACIYSPIGEIQDYLRPNTLLLLIDGGQSDWWVDVVQQFPPGTRWQLLVQNISVRSMRNALTLGVSDIWTEDELIDKVMRHDWPSHLHIHKEHPPDDDRALHQIKVRLLGAMDVMYNDQLLPLPNGEKRISLLAYLLMESRHPISRDRLLREFWPEVSSSAGRNNLHVNVHQLRKWLSAYIPLQHIIPLHQGGYSWSSQITLRSDVQEWEELELKAKQAAARQQKALLMSLSEQLLLLYRGAFLAGMGQMPWIDRHRTYWRDRMNTVLNLIIDSLMEDGQYTAALRYLARQLELDPGDEATHVRLMLCYEKLGKPSKAVAQYHLCRQILREDYGLSPSPSLRKIYESLVG